MFAGKDRSLPERCFTREAPALPTIMERLAGVNTRAYYEHMYMTEVKSFITMGPGAVFTTLRVLCKLQMSPIN
jgi:hypothetical protein